MKTIPRLCSVAAAFAMLIAAGCGASPPDNASTAAAPTEFMAVGTLNSVNTEAGTVNISHNPVPAAGWPAMTMDFKVAEPGAMADLRPGERVDIHFKIESGMNATITHIAPIE